MGTEMQHEHESCEYNAHCASSSAGGWSSKIDSFGEAVSTALLWMAKFRRASATYSLTLGEERYFCHVL